MPATAASVRELHQLHQRARMIRDRLTSAPKTLAAREAALEGRKAALEVARKSLLDEKMHVKKHEHTAQGQQARRDDMKVKLNVVKKNEEYKAIQNQIALDNRNIEKTEGEILEAMVRVDEKTLVAAAAEADLKKAEAEVAAIRAKIEAEAAGQKATLAELEAAIVEAETILPEDQRERYRRTVKQRGADAMASVDSGACSGCFVTVTHQMMNELINGENMVFCYTCGRILYLAEEDHPDARRGR